MGTWGQLKEVRLPDLLALLAEREGVLVLKPPKRPIITIELVGGRLGTVREGKRPLPMHRTEERLLAIMEMPETAFNFRTDDPLSPAKGPELRAFALRLQTLYEEIKAVRNRLPAPSDRFILKEPRPCRNPRWAPIYERAERYLRQGISALELAELLHLPLPVAQHFLYEAAQSHHIVPVNDRRSKRLALRFPGRPATSS